MTSLFQNLEAMVGRMTQRERRLFLALVVIFCIFLFGGLWFAGASIISGLEEEIDRGRQTLSEIKRLGPKYLELQAAKAEIDRLVSEAQATSIRVLANEILKKIDLKDTVPGALGDKMSDIVSFEGKTSETPVITGKKKKGKGKTTSTSYILVEQKLEFRDVPWSNLFDFLDQVSHGKDLLFVTRLEVARKFNQMSHVRAEVTLGTLKIAEGESQEQKKGEK